MLQRRLAYAAGRLLLEGQGASMAQGFSRSSSQQQWQAHHVPPLATAAATTGPQLPPSSLRWNSDLVERKPGSQREFVYEGPFATAVGRVKKLSLFSCLCAVGAGPVILGLDASTTLTAKVSIIGTLAAFGVFTTGLLTWFTQPYVTRLRYEPRSDSLEVSTLSLLARPRIDRFHLAEVQEAASIHPLTSFQARGKRYYLDADHFTDKALLARLQPATAAACIIKNVEAAQQQQQHG